ncbi:MAG TPA: VWA domain-containing protein [Pyrinomonadaceae bacterium]|jgi:VWFA-related protein
MKSVLLSLTLCLQLVSNGLAQQPGAPPPPKLPAQKPVAPTAEPADVDVVKITTNLVQIDAVVTDRKGKHVTDLRAEEVEMLEDGKPQAVTNFAYINIARPVETPKSEPNKESGPGPAVPKELRPEQVQRTIALVVDDFLMSFDSVHYMKETLKKFLDEQMQPNDLVAIIKTSGGMGALQQFTSNKQQLYTAVEKLKWIPRLGNASSTFVPIRQETLPVPERHEDGTSELDDLNQFRKDLFSVGTLGALNYVVQGLREFPGRKMVVLFSDGLQIFSPSEPSGSSRILDSLRLLLDLANRSSVVINTMDARGLAELGLTASDSTAQMTPAQVEQRLSRRRAYFFESQQGLDYIATQTGGLSIHNTNDLNQGLKRIMDDQSGYYLIGYRPDESTFDGTNGRANFHHVSLKVKRAGKYNVRTRTGFYGVSDEKLKSANDTPQQQLISALLSPFSNSEVQLRLTSLFADDADKGSVLRSFLHVRASDLTFTRDANGTHKAVFELIAVTFGENGKLVDQVVNQHTIELTEPMFQKVARYGFTYNTTVPIKRPGAYQFRTALRDGASGRVGSASQFVEVPDVNKDRLMTSGLLIRGIPLDRYLKGLSSTIGAQSAADMTEDSDPMANTSVRQFRTGTAMVYALTIYNARTDKATGKPSLTIQARLFRNGQLVFTGNEAPFDIRDQTDPKRFGGGGAIQLGTSLTPGEYVLQIVVSDLLAKNKQRVATQWMDFEILK